MGKCISCGEPTAPSEIICVNCKGAGSPYGGGRFSIREIVEEQAFFRKGEKVEFGFTGSTRNPRAPSDQPSMALVLYVLITNERLVAIEEEGFFTKNHDLFESIELESIMGMSIRSGFLQEGFRINFQTRGGLGEIEVWGLKDIDPNSYEINGSSDLTEIRSRMKVMIQNKTKMVEERSRRDKVQILLDFSFLKTEMAKGGIVLRTVKCPNCGAAIDLPEEGSMMKCKYCGSTVLAQDIFEKLKVLIG